MKKEQKNNSCSFSPNAVPKLITKLIIGNSLQMQELMFAMRNKKCAKYDTKDGNGFYGLASPLNQDQNDKQIVLKNIEKTGYYIDSSPVFSI